MTASADEFQARLQAARGDTLSEILDRLDAQEKLSRARERSVQHFRWFVRIALLWMVTASICGVVVTYLLYSTISFLDAARQRRDRTECVLILDAMRTEDVNDTYTRHALAAAYDDLDCTSIVAPPPTP